MEDAKKTAHLNCNSCSARIDKFTSMGPEDFPGIPGLEAVLRGVCPSCGYTTWDIRGNQQACEHFMSELSGGNSDYDD